jgi:DNA polymerase sigma
VGTVTTVVEQEQEQQQEQHQQQPAQQPEQAVQDQQALQPQQYSPLHYDIQKFARQIVPTDQETAEKQHIIQW